MIQTIRAFIAFPLPEMIKIQISDIQERLKSDHLPVRWVRPENIHLTLKFLGEISTSSIDVITGAIRETVLGCRPLMLVTKGIGVFPGIKKPRVLWIGTSGDIKPLLKIQGSLESNLEKQGFAREKRPFKSHLTLGRFKGQIPIEKLSGILRFYSDFSSEPFEARELILYRSELRPSGAIYTKIQTLFLEDNTETRCSSFFHHSRENGNPCASSVILDSGSPLRCARNDGHSKKFGEKT